MTSAPAAATGASFSSTRTFTVSRRFSVPSLTRSENVSDSGAPAATSGAVNVVDADDGSSIVTAVPAVWDHSYVIVSPSASDAVPERFTEVSSKTVWSLPAFTVGGELLGPLLPPPPPPPPQAAIVRNDAERKTERMPLVNGRPRSFIGFQLS